MMVWPSSPSSATVASNTACTSASGLTPCDSCSGVSVEKAIRKRPDGVAISSMYGRALGGGA